MAITVVATGSVIVSSLNTPQLLTAVTESGLYFLDVDVASGSSGMSVTLICKNATFVSGTLNQQDTTGVITLPQANGLQHIQFGPELCSQTNPGAQFTITQSGSAKINMPWALWLLVSESIA